MAEIENKNQDSKQKKFAFVKKNTRIDLTPMVDLGFLLITFFVFTTTLSTPTVMNMNMPYDKVPPDDKICQSCVLTVLLDKNNVIRYYEGLAPTNTAGGETNFGNKGIREIIVQKRKAVQKLWGTADDFVLIIKPSQWSTFQNFVDVLDEVTINGIKHYYTAETDQTDQRFLSSRSN